mmetsp:Transcript_59241/g.165408  ORF Transcript_59241/g.165408 Transcript_59241/m.165408 type:complete len:204 (-) Transcript_59241:110-721(-)
MVGRAAAAARPLLSAAIACKVLVPGVRPAAAACCSHPPPSSHGDWGCQLGPRSAIGQHDICCSRLCCRIRRPARRVQVRRPFLRQWRMLSCPAVFCCASGPSLSRTSRQTDRMPCSSRTRGRVSSMQVMTKELRLAGFSAALSTAWSHLRAERCWRGNTQGLAPWSLSRRQRGTSRGPRGPHCCSSVLRVHGCAPPRYGPSAL